MPGRMSPTGMTSPIMVGDPVGLGAADAGALEHPGEAVAAAQGGAKVDDRPLRALGQRLDRVGRRHPAAGVAAIGQRRDGERARFLELGVGIGRGRGAGQRRRSRPERPGGVAERGAGDEAAEPFAPSRSAGRDRRPGRARRRARADRGRAGRRPGGPAARGRAGRRRRQRSAAARRTAANLTDLIQGRSAPARPFVPRRAPRPAGRHGCEEKRLKSNYGI